MIRCVFIVKSFRQFINNYIIELYCIMWIHERSSQLVFNISRVWNIQRRWVTQVTQQHLLTHTRIICFENVENYIVSKTTKCPTEEKSLRVFSSIIIAIHNIQRQHSSAIVVVCSRLLFRVITIITVAITDLIAVHRLKLPATI